MDAISSIGSWLGSGAGQGVLKAGTVGGGFLQNWLANREAQKKQQFVENLVTNPQKWNAFVASKEQPLSAGLTADIARSTDAYGAERGLGSSGPIMKDVYAQALAPYIQNEQQMAQQAALQSLGIYGDMPTTRPADITSLLKLFMKPPQSAIPTANAPQPAYGGIPTTQIGGGQVPVDAPPIDIPDISNSQPFDYGNLISNGVLGAQS